jgi:tRNA1Val (adenine37-N6)-methyltransferase
MKVGTDGVLLGAWVSLSGSEKKILDIGTGTGVIALMLAQRTKSNIDAIEMEENAFLQAQDNIDSSPWAARVKVYHKSLQEFNPEKEYDLIVTNPPFFSKALKNPDKNKSIARHNHTLRQEDLIEFCENNLHQEGKLALILPVNEAKTFMDKSENNKLHCSRITYVKPTPAQQHKRMLMEFSRIKKPLIEDYLIIENNKRHDYSQAYIELTKAFYLHF